MDGYKTNRWMVGMENKNIKKQMDGWMDGQKKQTDVGWIEKIDDGWMDGKNR